MQEVRFIFSKIQKLKQKDNGMMPARTERYVRAGNTGIMEEVSKLVG